LAAEEGSGWRAAEKGKQIIRIVLDNPRTLIRIRLEFSETGMERTQEFTGPMRLGGSEKSFDSNGRSVPKAQPAKSKIIRSS
jgi:hypothetical protein